MHPNPTGAPETALRIPWALLGLVLLKQVQAATQPEDDEWRQTFENATRAFFRVLSEHEW